MFATKDQSSNELDIFVLSNFFILRHLVGRRNDKVEFFVAFSFHSNSALTSSVSSLEMKTFQMRLNPVDRLSFRTFKDSNPSFIKSFNCSSLAAS